MVIRVLNIALTFIISLSKKWYQNNGVINILGSYGPKEDRNLDHKQFTQSVNGFENISPRHYMEIAEDFNFMKEKSDIERRR